MKRSVRPEARGGAITEHQSTSITEEEIYSEHRSALDATIFRPSVATVTFLLDSGLLSLVGDLGDADEGDLPRE